ncbi:hypothetical protein PO124_27645 [Bacillus licheniformis]|nr:hypothetical protein [Bacillus licheniformis]
MDKLSKQAGITLPKGAGPLVDEAGAKLIKKHGEDALRVFTKLHLPIRRRRSGLRRNGKRCGLGWISGSVATRPAYFTKTLTINENKD